MNTIEMSDVIQYIETIDDTHIKTLLENMRFEYSQYSSIGTPEECDSYKKYCKMSVFEVLEVMRMSNKALLDEIECLKQYYEKKLVEQNHRKRRSKKPTN